MHRNQSIPLPAIAWTRLKRFVVVLATGLCTYTGYGQTLVPELRPGSRMVLRGADLAVLERKEPRNDLKCTVSQIKPSLDWDFNFYTGYNVAVPLSALVGDGDELTVLFRVIPQDRPDEVVYMTQRLRVPALEDGTKGEKTFYGPFELGEGKYHIDWLMRDRRERVCSTSWDLEARLNSKDAALREWIPKEPVHPVGQTFAEGLPVPRKPGSVLPHVSIIVNFDPPEPSSAALNDRDVASLVATLRQIGRDPRIDSFSIIACSLGSQQILYQQERTNRIDFQALGKALPSLKLGRIDAKRLASVDAGGEFATGLIREQIKMENPDALVILGRKPGGWGPGVSRQALESLGNPEIPVFYLSYFTDPVHGLTLSRDAFSIIMKRLRGLEYQIYQPKDLFQAWSKVVSRIVGTKQDGQATIAGWSDADN